MNDQRRIQIFRYYREDNWVRHEGSSADEEWLQELIYQRCLIIEFRKITLSFLNEVELPIFYDNIDVGKRRVDFLVENKVIIEIKAVSELTDAHLAQALNYLEVLNLEIGLLINFGSKSLEVKRIINNKYKQSFQST